MKLINFKILSYRLSLNSNFKSGFIFLMNSIEFLPNLEIQTLFEFD
jgi:hypothetical protein